MVSEQEAGKISQRRFFFETLNRQPAIYLLQSTIANVEVC